ncbi:hypothetical protein Tco_0453521 [Tanacetum coccineum]
MTPPIQNKAPSVDPILIRVQVHGRQVGRVFLDGGAAYDIIYDHYFLKLVYTILSRFSDQVNPLGEISLQIMVGEASHHRSEHINFLIVRSDCPQNMLFGRTAISELGMIPSTMHSAVLTLKIGSEIYITEHKLNEDKKIKPVQQKKRGMAPKRSAAASKEVEEL